MDNKSTIQQYKDRRIATYATVITIIISSVSKNSRYTNVKTRFTDCAHNTTNVNENVTPNGFVPKMPKTVVT